MCHLRQRKPTKQNRPMDLAHVAWCAPHVTIKVCAVCCGYAGDGLCWRGTSVSCFSLSMCTISTVSPSPMYFLLPIQYDNYGGNQQQWFLLVVSWVMGHAKWDTAQTVLRAKLSLKQRHHPVSFQHLQSIRNKNRCTSQPRSIKHALRSSGNGWRHFIYSFPTHTDNFFSNFFWLSWIHFSVLDTLCYDTILQRKPDHLNTNAAICTINIQSWIAFNNRHWRCILNVALDHQWNCHSIDVFALRTFNNWCLRTAIST